MHISLHRDVVPFCRQVFSRFQEDRCLQLASSLTFTTLLALVPLLTVMLTVGSAFPALSGLTGNIDDFIASHVLPEQISKTVLRYIDQFSQRAGRLTLIGLGVLTAVSFLTMLTIERAFNIIWRSPHQRPLVQRIVVYWAILTLAPVLIGIGLTMTSYLVTASMGIAKAVPLLGVLALWLMPFVLTIAAFTLLYYVMPGSDVGGKHALIGGITAGILFELAKRGFAAYVSNVPSYTLVYGTFATFPIFLLWIYLSWLVTLLGAIVTASLPDFGRFITFRPRPPGSDFCDVLGILLSLSKAQVDGDRLSSVDLAIRAGITGESCNHFLAALSSAGWVTRTEDRRWVLACDARSILLSSIYRHFVLDARRLSRAADTSHFASVLERHGVQVDETLGLSIGELLEKNMSTA
jgi:membrane protein